MEPRIHELREDYALRKIPTASFAANALYLEIVRLAYNLVTAFQRNCLDESWQNLTLQNRLRKQEGNDDGGDGQGKPCERAGNPYIKKLPARSNRGLDANERSQGADQGRRGNKIGVADTDSVMAASKVVSKFVRHQNSQESEGKRKPEPDVGGIPIEVGKERPGQVPVERGKIMGVVGGDVRTNHERRQKRKDEKKNVKRQ